MPLVTMQVTFTAHQKRALIEKVTDAMVSVEERL
jgi:phenylpyruvate tautomerase PptA (4-oxalocrotonate tautomerase family)